VRPARDFSTALRGYQLLPGSVLRAFSDIANRREWLRMISELSATDLRPDLPHITAPATVVCGSLDRRALPAARELAVAIPGARLWVAPFQRHSWPMTSPRLFGRVVAGFARGSGAGPAAASVTPV
jgi:pimeloyl-ACP methyl ester carboxylesterase